MVEPGFVEHLGLLQQTVPLSERQCVKGHFQQKQKPEAAILQSLSGNLGTEEIFKGSQRQRNILESVGDSSAP